MLNRISSSTPTNDGKSESFDEQVESYTQKHKQILNKELDLLVSELRQFDEIELKNYKNIQDFQNNIWNQSDLNDLLIKLNTSIEIKLALVKNINFSDQFNLKIKKLEESLQVLKATSNEHNSEIFYRSFIIPIIDDFWNLKYAIEVKFEELIGKRHAIKSASNTSSNLNFLDLPNDMQQEIFSYIPQDKKIHHNCVSTLFSKNMRARYILDSYTSKEIIKAIAKINDPIKIINFLTACRRNSIYLKLCKTPFTEMNNDEAVCFTLIRSHEHTHLITSTQLNKVIQKVAGIWQEEILKSLMTTSLALEYSENHHNHHKQSQIAVELETNLSFEKRLSGNENLILANLAGIDMRNFAFTKSNLRLVDLSGVKFSQNYDFVSPNFQGALLINVNFENLRLYYINPTSSSLAMWKNDIKLGKQNLGTVHFFDGNSLKNKNVFVTALNNLWKTVNKNQSFWTGLLCDAIACNLVERLTRTKGDVEYKLKLIEIALNHAMFNRNPPALKSIKNFINNHLGFFIRNYDYFPTDDCYEILIDYKNELLETSPVLKEKLDKKEHYYENLRHLAL